MKKLLLFLVLLLLLVSCTSRSPDSYHTISDTMVDGYYIYEYDHNDFFCRTYYVDIYYSDENYNYGLPFYGCSPDMTFFIKMGDEYIYIIEALKAELISMESLLPLLTRIEREPEDISTDEADYYWLDYYIYGQVVYAYAGGECDQSGSETFTIGGIQYVYTANGCLKNNILFMQISGEYIPIAELILSNEIDAKYLIPLLEEKS